MKRSPQVALLLMGAAAVGGTGYAMMPRSDCTQPGSPAAVSAGVKPNEACPPSSRSSSSSSGSSGRSWWSSSHSGSSGSGTSGSGSGHSSTSRGGFGSTGGSAHASS
jgi:hypothetical protein